MAKKVFYSFCYDDDVFRVQQIRNIGAIEDETILTAQKWEEVKRKGNNAIENWINDNMNYKDCVIVLVGENTSNRPWVKYEIELAQEKNKPMFGIYIHNLKDPKTGKSKKGKNPFDEVFGSSNHRYQCYDPQDFDIDGFRAYNSIAKNIESWFDTTVAMSKSY
jgi:hypothetical protein